MALTKIDDRGITYPLDLIDNEKIRLGTGNDLQIFHDGSDSWIRDTGTGRLNIDGSQIQFRKYGASEVIANFIADGAVELYENGGKRFETTASGWKSEDGVKGVFGTGDDLQIYHDGTHSRIVDHGSNATSFQTGELRIHDLAANEYIAKFVANGAVELYYDNSKKLETDASGVKVSNGRFYSAGTFAYIESSDTSNTTLTLKKSAGGADSIDYLQLRDSSNNLKLAISGSGDIDIEDNAKLKLGTGDDLQIWHDGSHSVIKNSTGSLYAATGAFLVQNAAQTESQIISSENGAVELFYDNVKKVETTSDGATLTGRLSPAATDSYGLGSANLRWANLFLSGDLDMDDDDKIKLGTGDDLQIYHNGTHSFIQHTYGSGNFFIESAAHLSFKVATNETGILANANGAVELYYDNVKQFETLSNGVRLKNGHLQLNETDSMKAIFGASDDLQIYHDGSNSYIHDGGTGQLRVSSSNFKVLNAAQNETIINAVEDGAVSLYHDNAKKLETYGSGIIVYGPEGGAGLLNLYADEGDDNADKWRFSASSNGSFYLQNYTSGAWESNIRAVGDGAVELFYDNSKKLETESTGIGVTGNVDATGNLYGASLLLSSNAFIGDNNTLNLGTGNDLSIYHNGSHNYIDSSNGYIYLRSAGGENMAIFEADGGVNLYYNNSKKLSTTANGVKLEGSNLWAPDNVKINIGQGDDLQIYHDGSNSIIAHDGGGNLQIKTAVTESVFLDTNTLNVRNGGGTENLLKAISDGAVELYYDNVKKLETTSTGINIGVASPQYAKPVNIQGGNGPTLSLSNQDYTDHAADSHSGIEGRIQCGNSIWSTSGVRFSKANGTAGDKHTKLELFVTDGYANQTGLIVNPDGEVTKPKQPSFLARAGAGRNNVTGAVTFTSCDTAHNVSGSYDTSNSRFTAPVAGWYHFGGQAGYKETNDNYNIKFMVNGSYEYEVGRVIGGSNDDSWQTHSTASWSQVVKLSANDYVEINTAYEMHQNSTYSNFWGYLIK